MPSHPLAVVGEYVPALLDKLANPRPPRLDLTNADLIKEKLAEPGNVLGPGESGVRGCTSSAHGFRRF